MGAGQAGQGMATWQPMRQLLLLRHAKSSWDDPALSDHARPLNARGRRAAAAIAQAMRELGLAPDIVLVSSARRTLQTLEALTPFDDPALIEPMDALYLAPWRGLLAAIQEVPETARSLLVIGHNPGLHELAMALAGEGARGHRRQGRGGPRRAAWRKATRPAPWSNSASPAPGTCSSRGRAADQVHPAPRPARGGSGGDDRVTSPTARSWIPRWRRSPRRPGRGWPWNSPSTRPRPRLSRHPAIAAARGGRTRGTAEELIWLDSADGALAGRPGAGADAARPAADAADHAGAAGPGCRAARRSWSRRRPPARRADGADRRLQRPAQPIPLATPEGPVQAVLLAGKLRAVANEAPAARLLLEGAPEAVLGLATRLAADLPLLPQHAALAEEGRALARGEAPRARRRGPPDLAEAGTVEEALLGAIGHLLEVMLHHAPACRLGTGPEGVHQMRVGLRRLRSVLKVFRPAAGCPALQEFDAGLKALANRLGPARDWDVFLGGLGTAVAAALPGDKRIAALLKAGEAKRQAAYAALRAELEGVGFRRLVLAGLGLLLRRPWRQAEPEAAEDRQARLEEDLPEFAAALLDKRWHKLCARARTSRTTRPRRCTRCGWRPSGCATRWSSSRRSGRARRPGASKAALGAAGGAGARQRHRRGARPGRLARRRRAGLGGRRGGRLRHGPGRRRARPGAAGLGRPDG